MAIGWKRRRQIPEVRFLALDARTGEAPEFRMLKSEATIGSGEDNQLVIRRASVSRSHASLAFRKDHFEISDLGSTNGTFVNGRRVSSPVDVEVGDEIRFGDALFVLGKPAAPGISSLLRQGGLPKKVLTLRGTLEVVLLAFAVGFGAAQYLAYLLYHEQNRLILAEATPINQARKAAVPSAASNSPAAQSTGPRVEVHARASASPKVVAGAVAPSTPAPIKVTNAVTIGEKELAGGIALARLIASSGTEAGRPAADFTLPYLTGSEVALDKIRGKVVLLNFWATWCGACRSEMPSLEALYRDFRHYPDFAVLTVSIDQRGKPAVAQFMASKGYNFPVLLDTSNVTSAAYGVSGIPSTFVIGRNGQIIWNCVGALDWSNPSVRDALKKLL
jgi:pSer/pThr/pTyr-binding forkhead associated (FHA) protein/peroxiredoxin